MSAQSKPGRRVVAQISMTLDGRVTGPEGPADMEVIGRYAGSDAAHARSAEALAAATTALLGRLNYEGFYGYWPPIVDDETADPRDRNIARWLDDVEKVVFSTTMTDGAGPTLGSPRSDPSRRSGSCAAPRVATSSS